MSVSLNSRGKWIAKTYENGKSKYIGSYDTKNMATRRLNKYKAERELKDYELNYEPLKDHSFQLNPSVSLLQRFKSILHIK